MYHPQQKQYRYMTTYLCDKYKNELEGIQCTWKEYSNEEGILIAILPTFNIVFKG